MTRLLSCLIFSDLFGTGVLIQDTVRLRIVPCCRVQVRFGYPNWTRLATHGSQSASAPLSEVVCTEGQFRCIMKQGADFLRPASF
jgi:hypothetical protein